MESIEDKKKALKEFMQIPGVGKAGALDFWDIGLRSIDDLVGQDPQYLYETLCAYQNTKLDRCVLYVFRCAVYFASEKDHNPELLKWWNWKD